MAAHLHGYTSSIAPEQGFHFFWTTTFHQRTDLQRRCTASARTLALRFVLPPSIFADPYELDLYQNTFQYHLSYEPDLERPVWAARNDTAVLRINATLSDTHMLSHGTQNDLSEGSEQELEVTLPVHARYGQPCPGKSFELIQLLPPSATLCCGDDAMLGCTPLQLLANEPRLSVRIPLGRTEDLHIVEMGTVFVVFGAFVYLLGMYERTVCRLYSRDYVRAKAA